jgi:hypothetical protein
MHAKLPSFFPFFAATNPHIRVHSVPTTLYLYLCIYTHHVAPPQILSVQEEEEEEKSDSRRSWKWIISYPLLPGRPQLFSSCYQFHSLITPGTRRRKRSRVLLDLEGSVNSLALQAGIWEAVNT